MNGREALKALAEGKRVREGAWAPQEHIRMDGVVLVDELGEPWVLDSLAGQWSIVETPATDTELILEWRRQALVIIEMAGKRTGYSDALERCALQLDSRSIK